MDIYNRIVSGKPFCFVRINDGETSVIISADALASRGDEQASPGLSNKLLNILTDKWSDPNLFIGVPCYNCYNECFNFVKNELSNSKDISFIQNNTMDANILINSNYDKTLKVLMDNLVNRNVIVISNEIIIGNINRLLRLGIVVNKTYTVSTKKAYQNDYLYMKDIVFEDNSFIITLCGPLGRVLAYEWYKQNQTLSCLDLGSFFDPLLRNKAYLYHTNNHRYCPTCYPVADPHFTKIFDYCTEPVDKECYYMGTLQDHINLYNKDYNRIILNMKVRLEKDPDNYDLMNIMTCCKIRLIQEDNKEYKKIIELCRRRNPKKSLVIGSTSIAIVLLENSSGYVSSNVCSEIIEYIYNRYTSINETDIYDIIYIDGTLLDIINCYYKSTAETILIISKNNKAYDKCITEKLINAVYEDDEIYVAKYNWFNNGLIRQNNLAINYMGKYNYIANLINDDNELKKLMTHIEETKLLSIKKDSNEGYAFQVPDQFEDLVNFCHSHSFTNILEIGFLHGSSALMFLLNTDAKVTSIDHVENIDAENYLLNKYPGRFTMLHGNSKEVLDSICNEVFDLVYIDGGHAYETVKNDIKACNYLTNENTIFIMNDVVSSSSSMFWNDGPNKVYSELDKKELYAKTYCKGRGLSIFQLNYNIYENTLCMTKHEMFMEIMRIVKSGTIRSDLLIKLSNLSNMYLKYFSIIDDCDQIKQYCITVIPKIIHLVYINQRPLKSFNYKCIYSIFKHMPDYQVYIHNDIEPDTEEWLLLKQNKNVTIKKINRVKEFDSFVIDHVQYEADIIRMNILYEYGGVYLDTDVYILKNIDSLLDGHSFYIAKETEDNFINCVIISEPGNEFIKVWLEYFATGFRVGIWGWHIRDLPKLILDKFPHYINKYNIGILGHENFCAIHWTQGDKFNDPEFKVTEKMYGIHLFETIFGNTLDSSVIINY